MSSLDPTATPSSFKASFKCEPCYIHHLLIVFWCTNFYLYSSSFPSLFILHLSGTWLAASDLSACFCCLPRWCWLDEHVFRVLHRFRKLLQRDQLKKHVFQIWSGCSVSKTHHQSATPQNPSFHITRLLYLHQKAWYLHSCVQRHKDMVESMGGRMPAIVFGLADTFDSILRVGLCLQSQYPQIGSLSMPRNFQLAHACECSELNTCADLTNTTIFVTVCLKSLCHCLLLGLTTRHVSRDGCFHKISIKSCLVPYGFCCRWLHAKTWLDHTSFTLANQFGSCVIQMVQVSTSCDQDAKSSYSGEVSPRIFEVLNCHILFSHSMGIFPVLTKASDLIHISSNRSTFILHIICSDIYIYKYIYYLHCSIVFV